SGTWTYASLTNAFSTNSTYRLYVRGIDKALNTPADPNFSTGGVSFKIDFSSPTSQVTMPVNNSNVSNSAITLTSGTASDVSLGGSDIKQVQVRLGRSDGTFFNINSSGWEAPPTQGQNFQIATSLSAGAPPPVKNWTN